MGSKSAKLLFLGCGSSGGVPVIGCRCAVCTSKDDKNKRLRSSVLITTPQAKILVDAGPDFRQQALTYDLSTPPDALFITHTHYDHIAGLEELRVYNFLTGDPVPCYLSQESYTALQKLCYYHFLPCSEEKNHVAQYAYHIFDTPHGEFELNGHRIRYCTYYQGHMPVLGFRFGSLAYMTDIKQFDEQAIECARGADILVMSALRHGSSRVQFSLDEAIDFSRRVQAKRTIFMHMSHDLDYHHLKVLLPPGIEPAYDGMQIEFEL